MGNYTQAIQYFDKALSIDPHDVHALTDKGLSLDELGNDTGAIKYFDKTLAIDPHDVRALTDKVLLFIPHVMAQTENLSTYKAGDFSISYPSNWKVNNSQHYPPGVFFDSPNKLAEVSVFKATPTYGKSTLIHGLENYQVMAVQV